jgi:CDP-paratose 2-epimerase
VAFDNAGSGRRVLVTGGAGFVGGNLACGLKSRYPELEIICLDNLHRRGSELHLPRLRAAGIRFVHGDIRHPGDFQAVGSFDVLLECSAEPSVLAGYESQREYLLQTNLMGTIHCLEAALQQQAVVIFLSTSRVYPIEKLNDLAFEAAETRFRLAARQAIPGASSEGIAEEFPLDGPRSLYGASKLCSELLIQEYMGAFGMRAVINRCAVIAGPWQMGKVDQGIASWWLLAHQFGHPLSYIGYGGCGRQVRDVLHCDDLLDLIELQLARLDEVCGRTFNVGGGGENSLSLIELTELCRAVTGRSMTIGREEETRVGDVRIFITDHRRVTDALGWRPKRSSRRVLQDIHDWSRSRAEEIRATLGLTGGAAT